MKKKIILIDASGLLFRAYFAMIRNPLRTSNGQSVSATFGFLRMVFSLIKKYPCHSIAAAFDVPRASLERTKTFSNYKATRKETPTDLVHQIPIAKECLERAGIPALIVEGHEADDVIASLAKKYGNNEVLIFSGDKDLLQLVNQDVHIALPDKNSNDGVIILDTEGVKQYKGVRPNQIADYLAIVGDSSDNIPGVQGIGEKGALGLIQEYGSLENIYANLEYIKSTLAQKLSTNRENAFLSLELIKLQENLDVSLPKIGDKLLIMQDFAKPEFIKKLQELELFSLIKEITNHSGIHEESLFSKETATPFINKKNFTILNKSPIITLQKIENYIEISNGSRLFYLSEDQIPTYTEQLQALFAQKKISFIAYDLKMLIHFFFNYGISLPEADDIKILAYLLNPERSNYQITDLSITYLGAYDKTGLCFEALKKEMGRELVIQGMWQTIYIDIEKPLVPLLADIETKGVRIDQKNLNQLSQQIEEDLNILTQKIYHLAGREFNILSPKQLGQILFEDLGLKPQKKTKTKNFSTDEETLEILAFIHPLPKEILQYRSLSKLKNSYTDALPKLADSQSRVHTTLHQTVTATGRLSSGDPNLQNIPIRTELGREIRHAFIASPENILVSADYSQIELRLFASLSDDSMMKKFFLNGGDIHKHTAAAMFHKSESEIDDHMRRAAKTINYGISYGMSAFRLSNELGIEFSEGKKFINSYFETFPGVLKFMTQTLNFASENGYVKTLLGRRRPTPELFGKTPDKITNLSHPSRFAINAVLQGTAADIIKIAMLRAAHLIAEKYQNSAFMILQIHDELLFETHETVAESFAADLKNVMQNVIELSVPLEVEVGIAKNWRDAH
ncbi:DNA polymerase I [Brevinema andersonii]|uniref:DNA polymerase I n=1 Tax=Brevinema andersonii TaxID=34097 RepID=A0A1I1D2Q7_BREAD|nr:DNA polymerase I [Brevinema andersonii]SFB69289.1 DNA polymerase I [Brevinema andersonii]